MVEGTRQALSPEEWTALAAVSGQAAEYGTREWNKPKDYLVSLVEAVKLDEERPQPDLAKAIDSVLATVDKVEQIKQKWTTLEGMSNTIRDSGDQYLVTFGEFIRAETRSDQGKGTEKSLDELLENVNDANEIAVELSEFVKEQWEEKIDRKYLAGRPPVTPPPTRVKHRQWLQKVRDGTEYDKLNPADDPRKVLKPEDRYDGIEKNIGVLEQNKDDETNDFRRRFDQLKSAVAAITTPEWDRLNQPQIEEGVSSAKADLLKLENDLTARVTSYLTSRTEFLAAKSGIRMPSNMITEEWRKRLAELDKNIQAAPQLIEKANRLEEELKGISGELRPSAEDTRKAFDDILDDKARRSDWAKAVVREIRNKRETVLGKTVAIMPWENLTYKRDGKFESEWKQFQDDYSAWYESVRELGASFGTIEGRLNEGYYLDEKAKDGQSIRDLWNNCEEKRPYGEQAIQTALQPVLARLGELERLESVGDKQSLLKYVTERRAGGFEGSRRAWLRLATLSGVSWPASISELQQERRLREGLRASSWTNWREPVAHGGRRA